MSVQGGNKPSYVWTTNGTRWYIIESLAGSKILAQMYGTMYTSTWEIPESQFDAEFIEAKDVPYMADVLEHAPIAGWSSRLLRSDYAGFSTNVRRDSDNTNQDIGFVDSYGFDKAGFNTFVGAGNGYNEIWYDQFNAYDVSNATHNRQPQVNPSGGANSRPSFTYDGVNDYLRNNALSVPFQGTNIPISFCFLVNHTAPTANASLYSFGANGTNFKQYNTNFNAAGNIVTLRKDDAGTSDSHTWTSYVNNVYYILAGFTDGIDSWFLTNGVLVKIANVVLVAITPTKFVIGVRDKNVIDLYWKGEINESLLWNTSLGIDDLQAAALNMNQFYSIY